MDKIVHFVDYCIIDNHEKVYDIKFINENQLCTCDIGGYINCYEITKNEEEEEVNTAKGGNLSYEKINSIKVNDSSIFSIDYLALMTLAGMENGEMAIFKNDTRIYSATATEQSISKCKFITEDLFAVGEDSGKIFLYDIRTKSKPISMFKEQGEEISDIAYSTSRPNHLLSSSIDGTLCVYDIKKMKLYALSDCIEEEINCLQIVKDGAKVACGTGEGNIALFNWDWFGDYKDRIVGHPEGVLCMEKYNDNVVLTGCEDGGIRVNTVYPQSVRGIIAGNKEVKIENKEFSDVTAIGINEEEGGFLGAVSNIKYVKVYDISRIDFRNIEKKNDDDDDSKKNIIESHDESKGSKYNEDNSNDSKEEDHENEEESNDDEMEEVQDEEDEEEEEEDNNKNTKKKYQRPNKKESSDSSLSIDENKDSKDNIDLNKEESNNDNESNSNIDSDSDSDSDSSKKQKKKSKKVPSLGKKRYSEAIILKEKRKAFFNDL